MERALGIGGKWSALSLIVHCSDGDILNLVHEDGEER